MRKRSPHGAKRGEHMPVGAWSKTIPNDVLIRWPEIHRQFSYLLRNKLKANGILFWGENFIGGALTTPTRTHDEPILTKPETRVPVSLPNGFHKTSSLFPLERVEHKKYEAIGMVFEASGLGRKAKNPEFLIDECQRLGASERALFEAQIWIHSKHQTQLPHPQATTQTLSHCHSYRSLFCTFKGERERERVDGVRVFRERRKSKR